MTVLSQSASFCDPDGLGHDVTEVPPPRSSTFRISLSRMFSLIEEYDLLEGGEFQEHSKKRVIDEGLENSSGFLNCDQSKRSSVEVKLPSRGPCLLKDESQCEEYLHQNSEGDTRLHIAIVQQLPLLVRELVRKVPHQKYLDIKNDDVQTPLHVAVITRQADVITWLLEAGADRMLRDGLGNTALHLACQMGEMSCVKALTSSSQQRDVKAFKTCETKEVKRPCRVLDSCNAKELIKCLKVPIQHCQKLDVKVEKAFPNPSPGQTKTVVKPCQQKKTKAVDTLLERKVPTAFYQTFDVISDRTFANLGERRDIRCREEMKNQWFEINETDFFAGKVGAFSREEKHNNVTTIDGQDSVVVKEEILPQVEDCRASFSPQELSVLNYEGETCAHVAVNHCHLDVLRRLVECGVDLNAREAKSGNTVLHIAVERGIDCVSRYLLDLCVNEGGCNLETKNYAGRTVLDLALDVNPTLAEDIARIKGLNVGSIAKKIEKKCFRHLLKKSLRKGKS